jgi:hypothetical protein
MIQKLPFRISSIATAAAIVLLPAIFTFAQGTVNSRRIIAPVNDSDRVALAGSTPKNLSSMKDLGAAGTSMVGHHVTVVLQRTASQQAALAQYLSDVQNSESSQYHKWLTPADYGARFGVAADDVQTVTAWLQSQGLKIERVSPAANMISFSGTVGQLQSAFSTTIHSVSVRGKAHIANLRSAQIPRALSPVVKGVMGLDDFHPHSNLVQGPTAKFNATTHRIEPDLTLFDQAGNPYLYMDPSDAATIYDTPNAALNPSYSGTTYDGTGVTVGVVGDTDVSLVPVTNYRLAFLGETAGSVNLPTPVLDGSDPGTNGDELEAFLDLEVLGGIAPKAKINYYESDDTDLSAGLFDAMQRAINDNVVSILSISYGSCEANLGASTNQFLEEIYSQAAAQGITVTVSSGDSGSAGCDNQDVETSASNGLAVNGLGSTPYNVSVGGTDFDALGTAFSTYVDVTTSGSYPYWRTALKYIPENPWNDSTSSNGALANNIPYFASGGGTLSSTDIIGTGGGMSGIYSKPAFQSALTPADGARDVPDVSFLAGNGFYGAVWVLCGESITAGTDCIMQNGTFGTSTTFTGVGGTSAATPAFAGMLALVVQATGSRLGQANSVLYNLATNKYGTVFHDVTVGNNSVVCSYGTTDCGDNGFLTGYDAGTGYDLASGLGSVDAAAMVKNWASGVGTSSATTLTINGATSPVSVPHGTSLNFAVGITPTSAMGLAALVDDDPAATGNPLQHGQPFTIPISNGAGAASYNGLPGGQYSVYANYGGDTSTAASQSAPISVNIAPEPSSTMLTVNAYNLATAPIAGLSAIPYGSYIFADTTVYGTAEGYAASLGAATGTMTILDNGKQIGTSPINSGNASSFPAMSSGVYPFAAGTHTVTASFPGDKSYESSVSNGASFTVVQGPTSVQLLPTLSSMLSTATNSILVNIDTSSLGSGPTGTLTLTANGTTLGSTSSFSVQNQVGDDTVFDTVTFNVAGTALLPGPNTLTATYTGDANYTGSSATATVTVTEVAFTLQSTPLIISAGASTGNTAAISAFSYGGFTGPVTLSCTVTSTPPNATSPVTCSVPPTLDLTGIGAVTGLLTVNSTASTTGGAYTVTISGKDAATGTMSASTTALVTVSQVPGIALSNSGMISVNPGATAGNTSTLTLTPANGFQGVVSLSCAVTSAPSAVVDPIACGIAPAVVTINGTTAGTAVLSISSAPSITASVPSRMKLSRTAGGVLAALGFCVILPFRRRDRFKRLAALVLFASLGFMSGCGGSGNPDSPGQPGTSAGSYVVTVTANPAGGAAQTVTVNVTVN